MLSKRLHTTLKIEQHESSKRLHKTLKIEQHESNKRLHKTLKIEQHESSKRLHKTLKIEQQESKNRWWNESGAKSCSRVTRSEMLVSLYCQQYIRSCKFRK